MSPSGRAQDIAKRTEHMTEEKPTVKTRYIFAKLAGSSTQEEVEPILQECLDRLEGTIRANGFIQIGDQQLCRITTDIVIRKCLSDPVGETNLYRYAMCRLGMWHAICLHAADLLWKLLNSLLGAVASYTRTSSRSTEQARLFYANDAFIQICHELLIRFFTDRLCDAYIASKKKEAEASSSVPKTDNEYIAEFMQDMNPAMIHDYLLAIHAPQYLQCLELLSLYQSLQASASAGDWADVYLLFEALSAYNHIANKYNYVAASMQECEFVRYVFRLLQHTHQGSERDHAISGGMKIFYGGTGGMYTNICHNYFLALFFDELTIPSYVVMFVCVVQVACRVDVAKIK